MARIAAASVVAASVPLFMAGQANAATVTCTAPTTIFDVRTNGDLYLYQDSAPTTGGGTFTNIHKIGTGWQGRTLAGANGDVFSIAPSGDLRYLHFDAATNTWANNAGYYTIGTGFNRYLAGQPGAKLITADASGNIYAVDAGGVLRSYSYNSATHKLANAAGTVIDAGWGSYTRIFAGGPGVIYAVDANGNLNRFRYDATSQEFTEYADTIGSGWANVANVWSPGGDILYVTDQTGSLFWYRFNDDTQVWDNHASGKLIGSGWTSNVMDANATTNTCSVPAPAPVPATTPTAATATNPLALGATSGGSLPFYFYKDSSGHILYAQDNGATGLNGPATIGTGTYPSPVVTTDPNNNIAIGALDSSGKVFLGRSDSTVQDLVSVGGSFKTLAMTSVSNEVQLFGVDATNGHLWGSADTDTAGDTTAWHDLTPGLNSGTGTLTGPLAVASSGTSTYGVATLSDGTTGYFANMAGILAASVLPNSADYNLPAVTDKATTPTLFATAKTGGQVSTYTVAGGWTALPTLPTGVTAASAPVSSAVAGSNDIAVTVLGSDGFVYASNQLSASTYSAWQKVGTEQSATAPTLFSSNGSGVDLAFKGADGKIYHYVAQAPAAGGTLSFTGGGHSFN